jgi:hypothetical protein
VQKICDLALEKTRQAERKEAVLVTAAAAFLTYMFTVRYNRYKNLKMIRAKYPNPDNILNDSEAAQFVYNVTTRKEFPCE